MTTTVSSKYQIVIPKEAREKLGIRPGMRLTVTPSDQGLLLAKEPSLEDVQGLLKDSITRELIDEFDRTRGQDDRDLTLHAPGKAGS